jgi:hypothetical protein
VQWWQQQAADNTGTPDVVHTERVGWLSYSANLMHRVSLWVCWHLKQQKRKPQREQVYEAKKPHTEQK